MNNQISIAIFSLLKKAWIIPNADCGINTKYIIRLIYKKKNILKSLNMRVNTLSFCCLMQKFQLYNDIAWGENTGIPRKIRISIHWWFFFLSAASIRTSQRHRMLTPPSSSHHHHHQHQHHIGDITEYWFWRGVVQKRALIYISIVTVQKYAGFV